VTDWVNANFNRPLTSSDPIWGGDGMPTEIRVGSTAPRSNAAYQFLNADDRTMQIRRLLGNDGDPRPKPHVAATPAAPALRAGSSAATTAAIPPQGGVTQAAMTDGRR
jgi:hypothetical protein